MWYYLLKEDFRTSYSYGGRLGVSQHVKWILTMQLVMNSIVTSCSNTINMRSNKKTFSTFISFLLFLLIAFYFSYQIGKDAAHRDARIKARSGMLQQK